MPTPAAHLRLLEALGRATPKAAADPLWTRRVFVNRTVRMDHIEVLGFDMDYTLALYNQPKMEALSARWTVKKLIGRGWPDAIAELPYDPRMAIRGLVVDKKHGNILKMDRYGYVGRAMHGTRPLDREDRRRLYREQKLRLSGGRYAWIDTLFALPESVLYSHIVEFLDRDETFVALSQEARASRYMQLWTDIRECIDEAHRDDSIKNEITARLEDYIIADPDLATTLHRFRSAGRRLFLLTNSGFAYTDRVMSYLLDGRLSNYPSWRHYFDVIVVDAKKPDFFLWDREPQFLDDAGQPRATPSESERRSIMPEGERAGFVSRPLLCQGGNVQTLSELLALPADRVLYVGDHIYGDMLKAKKSSVWRTAMIIQELEAELERHTQVEESLRNLEALERRRHRMEAEQRYQQLLLQQLDAVESDPTLASEIMAAPLSEMPDLHPTELKRVLATPSLRQSLVAKARDELGRRIAELRHDQQGCLEDVYALERDIEHTFNPFWGPLFKEGSENSRFGEQVEDYACLYTSRVSNFLAYSPFQLFRSPRDHLPHERVY
ncbi:MAG: HAD-IG family 5'-nucleotidase [Myxococcales bacterium]|nr:HAD-IG family 5'-nucleotidase [Myxococcales bacterium]